MPEAQSPRDILAEVMAGGRKALVPHLAEMLKTQRIAEVPPDEERRRFWQRARTPEQEQQLWAEALAQRGLTPETLDPMTALDIGLGIAKEVYPARFDMMAAEGRTTQAEQARWAWRHAQAGPPKSMQEEAGQDATQGQGVPPAPVAAVRPPDQPGGAGPAAGGQPGPVVPQDLGQPAGLQAPPTPG